MLIPFFFRFHQQVGTIGAFFNTEKKTFERNMSKKDAEAKVQKAITLPTLPRCDNEAQRTKWESEQVPGTTLDVIVEIQTGTLESENLEVCNDLDPGAQPYGGGEAPSLRQRGAGSAVAPDQFAVISGLR